MKIFKLLSTLLMLVLAVVIGGATYLIITFDANHYKSLIIQQVKENTGRTLSLSGDIDLAVFPDIAITLGEAKLSNAKGFESSKGFASIKGARVAVKLMPLLNRKLTVKQVSLEGLILQLITKEDGTTSWGDLIKEGAEPEADKPKSKIVNDLLDSLSIAGLNLKDAAIIWDDRAQKQKIMIAPLALNTGVFKLGKPLDINYSFKLIRPQPLLKLNSSGETTITLSNNNQHFSLENLAIKLNGFAEPSADVPIPASALVELFIQGDISGSAKSIKAPNLNLQFKVSGDIVPEGELSGHFKANIGANLEHKNIVLKGLNLDTTLLGKYVDNGDLGTKLKGDVVIDLANNKVTMPTLDLVANLVGGYAKDGQSSAHIRANTSFDINNNLLKLTDLKFKGDLAGKLLQGGKAHAQLDSQSFQFDIKNNALTLNGVKFKGDLTGALLKGGQANGQLNSQNLQFSLKDDLLTVTGVKLKGHLNGGELLKGGKGNVQLESQNLIFNLKSNHLALAKMDFKGDLDGGELIKGGKGKAKLQSQDFKFNLNDTALTLTKMNFNGDLAGGLLEGGQGNAQLNSESLQFSLKENDLKIKGLKFNGNLVGGYLKGGKGKAKLDSQNFTLDLEKNILTLKGMSFKGNANGALLEGGSAYADFKSDSIRYDITQQGLNIATLKGVFDAKGGYLKQGKAHSTIATDLIFNGSQQQLKLFNVQLAVDAKGDLLQGLDTSTTFNGNLSLDLAKTQAKSTRFDLKGSASQGLLEQSKLNHQSKGHFDINWSNNSGVADLGTIQIALDDAVLKARKVTLKSKENKPSVTGHFSTNVISLHTLFKRFAIQLPPMKNPKSLSTAKASFQLTATEDSIDLQQLNLKIDGTTIKGRFAMQGFDKPMYQPDLTIDTLNLDDYLAPKSEVKQSTASSGSSANEALLPLNILRELKIKGRVKIGSLRFNDLSFSHLLAKIDAKNGLIKLNPLNASMYKGTYKGYMTIDAQNAVPQMKMRHALTDLRSESLLFDLFRDKYISGQANVVTELSAKGNRLDVLLASIKGTTTMDFKNGSIRDSNFAEKVSLAVNAFEKKSIKDGKTVVNFTGLSGDWVADQGIFTTNNLKLVSPYFSIEGLGTTDMAKQFVDMTLRIGSKNRGKGDGKKRLYAPLRIQGPFSDLKFSIDLKDLLKILASEDFEEAKRKAKEKLAAEKLRLKQKLADEKVAIKLKLATEKRRAEQQLAEEKRRVVQRLAAEKQQAAQRLAAKREQYQLKWKAEQASLKMKAEAAVQKRLGEETARQLQQALQAKNAAKALKQRIADEAAKKLQQKLSAETANQVKQQLAARLDAEAVDKAKQQLAEKLKTDKLKEAEDQLKNKFRSLF
ncbi:MAG: AsmA family protein [Thiotrichaceae bacterium]|nr:AsmA family protein [Thiotrichaceae bacterium]